MITKLEDRANIIQPETRYLCALLSADAPDPVYPGFTLEDGTTVWSIVMIDSRAPEETIGDYVVNGLSPEVMLEKLQKENWTIF